MINNINIILALFMIPDQRLADIDGPPAKNTRSRDRRGAPFLIGEFRQGRPIPPAPAPQVVPPSTPPPPAPPLHPNRRLGDWVCPGRIPPVRRGRKREAPPGPTEGEPPCKRRRLNPRVGTAGGALPQVTPEGLAEAPPLPPPRVWPPPRYVRTGAVHRQARAWRQSWTRPGVWRAISGVPWWSMLGRLGAASKGCPMASMLSSAKVLPNGTSCPPQTRSRAEVWANRWPRGRP